MPILTEPVTREHRQRNRKGLFLLLIPPVLLMLLAVSAAFRPIELQIGPIVCVVMAEPDMGESTWTVGGAPITKAGWGPIEVGAHRYRVTGSGHTSYVQLHRWAYGFFWFRGHPLKPNEQ